MPEMKSSNGVKKNVRRGFAPEDERQFSAESVQLLRKAGTEVRYLLNRGYHLKSVTQFVGDHYLFSERQRLALARSTAPDTLETALSGSTVFKGMDGCIRDLAGLRGTYRIIDVTKKAIDLLLLAADNLHAGRVNVFLDAPVSNSGRLKTLFYERRGRRLGVAFPWRFPSLTMWMRY